MARRSRVIPLGAEAQVTPLELFFDLVFVFALTQVTTLMAADLTGRGVVRGMLLIGLLWWSWTGYAWLCNVVAADEGAVRAALFAAMGAMFVLALAIPEAFDDLPGGLAGPVVVASCYFAFRALHLMLFWVVSGNDAGLRRQVMRFTPSVVGGTGLLLVASQLRGRPQTVLWGLALAADYGGTFLGGASGWRLRSPRHFAERHGLILIVALGESIVAIGVGVAGLPLSWPIVVASILGLTVSAALWWAYFDVSARLAEQGLAGEPEEGRARLARDAYSYLHLPMLAGVVLLALGMKKVLEYAGDTRAHDLGDRLAALPAGALLGGVAVYLLAHVGFMWRAARLVSRPRLVVAALALMLVPVAARVPALAALAMAAVLAAGLVAYECVRFAQVRDQVRHRTGSHGP